MKEWRNVNGKKRNWIVDTISRIECWYQEFIFVTIKNVIVDIKNWINYIKFVNSIFDITI